MPRFSKADKKRIAENYLKLLRKDPKYRQKDHAKKYGVSGASLSIWLKDYRDNPDYNSLDLELVQLMIRCFLVGVDVGNFDCNLPLDNRQKLYQDFQELLSAIESRFGADAPRIFTESYEFDVVTDNHG